MNKNVLKLCSALLAASLLLASCGGNTETTTNASATTTGSTVETTTGAPAETTTSAPVETTTDAPTETTTEKEEEPIQVLPLDATLNYSDIGNGVVKFDLTLTGEQEVAAIEIDTGDNFIAHSTLAYYAYPKTGTYNVSYKVTGAQGTVIEKELSVLVQEKVSVEGTPIVSVKPNGSGGSNDAKTFVDGVFLQEGTSAQKQQFDTYSKSEKPESVYAGIEFAKEYTIKGINFQEGMHFKDGGWFKTAPYIEVLVNGKWVKQDAAISKEYPEANTIESQGKSFETYTFDFGKEVKCNGVRIAGVPGGSASFISISEIEPLLVIDNSVEKTFTDNEVPLITCNVTSPKGSGNHDIRIIADGKIGEGKDSTSQYDTYVAVLGKNDTYIGYLFKESKTVNTIEFIEGMHFEAGGWFLGDITVEVLKNGVWEETSATISPKYYKNDSAAALSNSWETFTFTLEEAVSCDGIRLAGVAGGKSGFISVAELTVK